VKLTLTGHVSFSLIIKGTPKDREARDDGLSQLECTISCLADEGECSGRTARTKLPIGQVRVIKLQMPVNGADGIDARA
jgi:hypothetical protein